MAVRAVVQDSRRLYREGIAMVLADEPDIELVGTCVTMADVKAMCRDRRPDVVVVQADAGGGEASRLAHTLRRRQGTLRLVGLYESAEGVRRHLAYRNGFSALVSQQRGLGELLEAVRGTGRRRAVPPAAPSTRLDARDFGARLTARQVEVLRLVSHGSTTGEIAHRLGISPKTVSHHKENVFRRLGAQNQAHAVSIAMRRGLLTIDLGFEASDAG